MRRKENQKRRSSSQIVRPHPGGCSLSCSPEFVGFSGAAINAGSVRVSMFAALFAVSQAKTNELCGVCNTPRFITVDRADRRRLEIFFMEDRHNGTLQAR